MHTPSSTRPIGAAMPRRCGGNWRRRRFSSTRRRGDFGICRRVGGLHRRHLCATRGSRQGHRQVPVGCRQGQPSLADAQCLSEELPCGGLLCAGRFCCRLGIHRPGDRGGRTDFAVAVALFHENTKERKGLDTSPFGPSGLTIVPIPCVSVDSWVISWIPTGTEACTASRRQARRGQGVSREGRQVSSSRRR